jgi:opacity protein-like surface antigen
MAQDQHCTLLRITTGLCLLTGCLVAAAQGTAQAESYVAGQFGITVPSISGGLTNVDLTGSFPDGSTFSDNALKSSLMFGAKFGHFFNRVPWFGLETEAFMTNPHIKQQPLTLTLPPIPPALPNGASATAELPGAYFRVVTWAPVNLVFRYPGKRLQPYVAIGPGVFFARIKDPNSSDSQSDTRLGLNTQVGIRYFLTRHLAIFGEWKYNYARFHFEEQPDYFGFNGTYNMHHFALGLGYHF